MKAEFHQTLPWKSNAFLGSLTEHGEGPQAGERVQVREIPGAFAACRKAMSSC